VAFLQPNGADLSLQTIASWRPEHDDFQVLTGDAQVETLARWAQLTPAELMDEIERREEFLRGLEEAGAVSVPEVTAAIENYYADAVRGGQRR